jgi:hypothetical protein
MNSNGPAVMASSKKLRHRQVPDAVVGMMEVMHAVVVLVVVRDGVDLGLGVADLVEDCIRQATRGPGPGNWRPAWAKPRCATYSSGLMPLRNSLTVLR